MSSLTAKPSSPESTVKQPRRRDAIVTLLYKYAMFLVLDSPRDSGCRHVRALSRMGKLQTHPRSKCGAGYHRCRCHDSDGDRSIRFVDRAGVRPWRRGICQFGRPFRLGAGAVGRCPGGICDRHDQRFHRGQVGRKFLYRHLGLRFDLFRDCASRVGHQIAHPVDPEPTSAGDRIRTRITHPDRGALGSIRNRSGRPGVHGVWATTQSPLVAANTLRGWPDCGSSDCA